MMIHVYICTDIYVKCGYRPDYKNKNKNKCSTDKDNYRPICLSNMFSKVVEKVLYSGMQNWLLTTPNQFGCKPKHSTEMCVYVLK